jgi:hypothetical protein
VRGVSKIRWIAVDTVRRACLEEQDLPSRILTETASEDAARRASPHDDYVGATGATIADIGHGSVLLGSMGAPMVASRVVMRHRRIPVIRWPRAIDYSP